MNFHLNEHSFFYFSKGASRWVLCIGGYAIKFPSFYGYTNFLDGLECNYLELKNYRYYGKKGYYPIEKLCPIIFHLPLGIIIVMKRAKPLSGIEFSNFNYENFIKTDNSNIPAEKKPDSFGIINGKILAIDYAK